MKKTIILIFLAFLIADGYSQDHQSYNNYTGDWSNPASWEIGTGILNSGDLTYIYGYITVNGNLSLNNGRNLEVFDTLVVTGNLTLTCNIFGPFSDLIVHPGGLLIVLGNWTGSHFFSTIDGDMIVMGEVNLNNWFIDPLDVNGHLYLFDDTPSITPGYTGTLEDENDIPYPLDDFLDEVACASSDSEDPVLNLPAIAAVECIALVPATYADYAALVSAGGNATDNCDIVTGSFTHISDVSDNNSCPEIITRTYSIDDVASNTGTATQSITIDDNTNPTLTLPVIAAVQCIADVPSAYANYAALVMAGGSASDNCGVNTASFAFVSDVSDGNTCPEVVTRTYRISDNCGNQVTSTQAITIDDNINPTLTLPAVAAVQCIGDVPSAYANYAALVTAGGSASDNCGVNTASFAFVSDVSDGNTCPEVVTRTYRISDNCGNQVTSTQAITIDDNINPTLTLPAVAAVQCIGDVPSAYANYAALVTAGGSASDNCGVNTASFAFVSDVSDGNTCPEVVTRTYRISDNCGNQVTSTQAITIDDNINPTLTLPAVAAVQCIGDVPSAYANYAALVTAGGSASDNCGVNTASFAFVSDVSDGNTCPEVVTRTYRISDNCGNQVTSTQAITIDDNINPTLTLPAIAAVQCIGDVPSAYANYAALVAAGGSASDNCGVNTASFTFVSDVSDGNTCPEVVTRTYRISDNCGNQVTSTQAITIDDNINPTLTLPAIAAVQCIGDVPSAYANYAALVTAGGSASDNCGVNTASFTFVSDVSDGNTCPEVVTRTYRISDNCGNQVTSTQAITIDDNINPTLTLPAVAAVQCIADVPSAYANYAALVAAGGSASDNCGVNTASFAFVSDVSDGNTCPEVVTRTYRISDNCGNQVTSTQAITIDDNINPTLTLPAIAAVQCIGDVPSAYANYAALVTAGGSASDNCGVNTASFTFVSDVSDGNTCPEVVTRTYRISDNCGNQVTSTQAITIDDNINPTLTLPAVAAVQCIGDVPSAYANYAALVAAGGSASDNCGVNTASFAFVSDVSDGNTCPEVVIRTYRISDNCGNQVTSTQAITIDDNINPTLTLPAIAAVQCIGDVPSAYANYAALVAAGGSASDNCGVNTASFTFVSDVSDGNTCPEVVTRTYRISDNCGNPITATQSITVDDNINPTLTLPAIAAVQCIGDVPSAYANYAALVTAGGSASDNCDIDPSSFVLENEASVPSGNTIIITRTYRIYDNCGNSESEDQVILVEDDTPPSISCSFDIARCADNVTGAVINDIAPSTYSDNCTSPGNLAIQYTISGATIISGSGDASGNFFNIGISTIEYTVTDESGNTNSCNFNVTVNPLPVTSDIVGDVTPVCEAANINYSVTNTPDSKYRWVVPAGATILSDTTGLGKNSILVNFGTISGDITVTETNSYGCSGDTKSLSIALQGCTLIVDFESDKYEICMDDTISVWSTSSGVSGTTIYTWDFGIDAVPVSATGTGPHKVYYTTAGTKPITLTVIEGTSDAITKEILVRGIPAIILTGNDRCGDGDALYTATVTNADAVDFSTDEGASVISSDNSSPYEYTYFLNTSESITVWARANNTNDGCISEWSEGVEITAFPLPVTGEISVDSPPNPGDQGNYLDIACKGESRTYSVEPVAGSSYRWVIPSLNIDLEGNESIDIVWDLNEGEYGVLLQEISGQDCYGTIREETVFVSDPTVDLGPDQEICEGESYLFQPAVDFSLYTWQDNSHETSFTGTQTEEIWVLVENEFGCPASDTVSLQVNPVPSLDLGNDTTLCGDAGYELLVEGFSTYYWSTGETGNSIVVYSGDGQISLTATDSNSCSVSDTIVILECGPDELFDVITNTFTPNGDGVHDLWVINNIEQFPDAVVDVFDRNGRLVFHAEGYSNDWDGKCDGKPLPMDTYYYVIDFKSDQKHPVKGTITIVR